MNTEDYVSYPLALALKKAGFDELTNSFYDEASVRQGEFEIVPTYAKFNEVCRTPGCECVSAPTLWQAQKWLRDMKRLSIEPYANIAVAWNYNIADLDNFAENVGGEVSFPSYESALSAGIAAALELIEKKGE